jgi:hypothetical protein
VAVVGGDGSGDGERVFRDGGRDSVRISASVSDVDGRLLLAMGFGTDSVMLSTAWVG